MMKRWIATGLFFLLSGSIAVVVMSYAYDLPPKYDGRPLSPTESGTIMRALDSIKTPPPDSITVRDAQGNSHKESVEDIYWVLFFQLASGRMEAETKASESTVNHLSDGSSTQNDEMNVDSAIISWASLNYGLYGMYLEETLIHECIHKWQSTWVMIPDEEEIEALSGAISYKRLSGLPDTHSLMKYEDSLLGRHKRSYHNWEGVKRVIMGLDAGSDPYIHYIQHDPQGTGVDFFTSFSPDTSDMSDWYNWSFGATRASDMKIYPYHYLLPPGHHLALVCGSVPTLLSGRILALDIFQRQVFGVFQTHDFGPPLQSPMAFYSMTHVPGTPWHYVMDTLNQQIVVLQDTNLDSIPDTFSGVFANALWAAFAPLLNKRGIDAVIHPVWGAGIAAYNEGQREAGVIDPYDPVLFLKDMNNDQIADWCEMLNRYHFITFKPRIMEPSPWAGDLSVPLFAPWNRMSTIWTTDPLGNVLLEPLATVWMGSGVHMECLLLRPLMSGEYIIAADESDGSRLSLATRVIDPTPQKLTMAILEDGSLRMRWQSVPGAEHYRIYASDDAVDYYDTGLRVEDPEILMAPPGEARQFYSVTAEK